MDRENKLKTRARISGSVFGKAQAQTLKGTRNNAISSSVVTERQMIREYDYE
jgi:hypothetical protein